MAIGRDDPLRSITVYLLRDIMEGILMGAMIRDGMHLTITPEGCRRLHRSKIPMAMVENLRTRLQLIVLRGSDADVLRLVTVTNDTFRPSKPDKNGSTGGPTPASFLRPPRPAPSVDEASVPPPPPPPEPGTLLNADGEEYVSG